MAAAPTTPFHTKDSISAEESNYWGNYPYMIEDNYFNQSNLETRPGTSRYETVPVDSFEPNLYGLYNMHGNVGEWVWDLYGAYDSSEQINPAGADTGNLHISRGGGWNDFAKNVRSAYRATSQGGRGVYNIGIRLVRGAVPEGGILVSGQPMQKETGAGNVLIAYFSWGGNTREIAEEIAEQTGADLFEITCIEPYSTDYNTVLQEALKWKTWSSTIRFFSDIPIGGRQFPCQLLHSWKNMTFMERQSYRFVVMAAEDSGRAWPLLQSWRQMR